MAVSVDQPVLDPLDRDAVDGVEAARLALRGRRELQLLEDPSVLAMAQLLVARCRDAAPWVRAAVATVDRFAREVALGDLPGLLAAGRADPAEADRSLQRLARRHDGLSAGQMASLAFGPKLWWTVAGVPVTWLPLSQGDGHRPLPSVQSGVRLLLLSVIGSGATQDELRAVRVGDAGSLDAAGRIVPDVQAEPLAVAYRDVDGEHLTFLSYEARQALLDLRASLGPSGPDDLLLPAKDAAEASTAALATGSALIGAGNDVNVTLCRATGDFFRAWGMPGARFDIRTAPAEEHP